MSNSGIALSLGLGVGAAQLPYPLINGFAFSYASVEGKFNLPSGLFVIKGFKAINYKAPLEETKIWGSHPEPYARTIGKQDYEADCEMYLAEANALQTTIGPGWSQVMFDMIVTYSTPGYLMIVDTLVGCRLMTPETGITMGSTEGVTRKFTLNPMSMRLSGQSMLLNPLAGALT